MQFFDVDKFSDCKCLLNLTVLILRFINNLKNSLNQEEEVIRRYVTAEEYSKAEHLWLMFMQHGVTKITIINSWQKI